MIRNLGQVAAIYIGSSAPRNTNLIWLDNTVVPFVFRAYDGSAWSEIATHKWVRAYVDGWLVTLPPRQLADDGDYMLINSNNVNYKITVKDFVKSAVGNPLDFKGVIRVSADFPNPSTLESGDMYVIITSPVGGTVTDPYSGKTFKDSEKIVWDEVTQSWESLGKIDIAVDLTTSYSETEVTIHSSAGKETTIQGATDQLAGVMLPGQYSWLQALSNGSIVPGDPSPLTPLTPAHKHNYSDIINRLVSQQGTGESTIDPMSQKATTDALNLKFDKASVLQVSGAATDKVMSQKAVTDVLKTLSDDFNNKLTNYLPLAGGTMKGNIRFPVGNGIACNDVAGTAAYVVLRTLNANNSTRMCVGTVNFPTYISSTASDLIHDRNGSSYLLWDTYNLSDPVTYTTNAYNHATLKNKNRQYFTYIKAGTDGLLPHSQVTLASGGSGSLGTSDQGFNAAYINHLHTNRIIFGETGPYIIGSTSATQFLNAEGSAQKVATGGLYVGTSYASNALSLVPANGIYSQGNIKTSGWLTFEDNEWTNTGWAYKEAKGSIKVLSVINETENRPTVNGSVFQFNSRQGHWCTQIWCDQTNVAGVIGTLRFRTTKSYASTEWNPWTALVTEFDLNNKLTNYLPLAGGTMKGNIRFPVGNGIACNDVAGTAAYVVLRTLNANNSTRMCVGTVNFPTYISSTASDLIHDRNGSSYLLWDTYNLSDPVTYTTNAYNHATLKNKNRQYFTYIKAGTDGLLPHSQVTLASGGSGSLGTSDQGFNAAYINHLHTNRIIFGETGPYIIGSTSATQFLNAEGSAQKVATGGLYVGTSYASNALSLVPANGIYSQGNIKTSGWLTFEDNEWTNTGWAYKEAKGSIKVLSVINETENRPTVNGSVFQFNSRQGHWCTQIWCDQTNVAGVIGTLRFRTTKSYASTEWNPWTALVTEFDLNNYLTKTEASTLYYPYSGRGYLSITSSGRPVMSNNQGYAVKDKDGNEREVLWMGPDNSLNLGNTNAFTLNLLNLRCTTLTYNGNKIATEYYVTNQLANYLPLSGGTISSSRSSPLDINSTHASQSSINFSRRDVNKGAVGFHESLGFFLQNASGETLAVKSDGAYYGVNTNSLRKLATSTDLNNYLPLTGGVLTGSSSRVLGIDFSGGSETFIRVLRNGEQRAAIGFKDGLGAYIYNYNSNKYLFIDDDGYARVGIYSDGTRLALITDIPTIYERAIGINGTNWAFYAPTKATTVMIYSPTSAGTSGQILQSTGGVPTWVDASSISPSISISNSGTGNAVTSITTDGHTLTVTKGATYLTSHQTIYDLTFQAGTFSAKTFDPNGAAATVNIPTNTSHLTNDSGFITSSALNGYATQSWVNSQNFVKSTSTKKVTDIQPVDALPATQVSGVLYLVFG